MVTNLIIQLVMGAIGGNAAGKALGNFNMGPLMNSASGAVGGLAGGGIMGMLGSAAPAVADAAGGMDMGAIASQVAGGGVGGAVLMVLVGFVKNMMGDKGSSDE